MATSSEAGLPDLTGHRHVLVVEDEYHQASLLAAYLELEGYEVLGPVANVPDALRVIDSEGTIDCAVLDVNLAGDRSFAIADLQTK